MDSTWPILIFLLSAALGALVIERLSKLAGRVDAIDRKVSLLLHHSEVGKQLTSWQKLALEPSSKIQAIRAYMDATGAGLADAKKAVEQWVKSA